MPNMASELIIYVQYDQQNPLKNQDISQYGAILMALLQQENNIVEKEGEVIMEVK